MNNIDNMSKCLEKLAVPLTEAHKKIIYKLVEDLKTMKIKGVDDYVDEFYDVFEFTSKERHNRYPMLMEIFEEFIREIRNEDENYKLMRKIKHELDRAIESSCTKEQLQLIDGLQCIENIINLEMTEKAFIFGYAMCNEIKEETKNIYE